jgi:hypothetical protein
MAPAPDSPHLHEARNSLAFVLGRLGDIPAAIGQFQLLLTEEPDNAEFHGNFAVLPLIRVLGDLVPTDLQKDA